jgi:hypothetical protein
VHERRTGRRRLLEREPVLLVTENVFDGAIAIGLKALGTMTGGFQPIGAVDAPEPPQAETRAGALLRMRPPFEQARHEAARRRPGLLGPRDQA